MFFFLIIPLKLLLLYHLIIKVLSLIHCLIKFIHCLWITMLHLWLRNLFSLFHAINTALGHHFSLSSDSSSALSWWGILSIVHCKLILITISIRVQMLQRWKAAIFHLGGLWRWFQCGKSSISLLLRRLVGGDFFFSATWRTVQEMFITGFLESICVLFNQLLGRFCWSRHIVKVADRYFHEIFGGYSHCSATKLPEGIWASSNGYQVWASEGLCRTRLVAWSGIF